MSTSQRILVVDANVLIDYVRSEPEMLRLAATHIGSLLVPSPVALKVRRSWSEQDIELGGLQITVPTKEQFEEAADKPPNPAFDDWCCLIVARDCCGECVTNDSRLRRECTAAGVKVLYGMELLLELAHLKIITANDARRCAGLIQKTSPGFFHVKIMEEFDRRLKGP